MGGASSPGVGSMATFGRDPGRLRRHPGPPAALSSRDRPGVPAEGAKGGHRSASGTRIGRSAHPGACPAAGPSGARRRAGASSAPPRCVQPPSRVPRRVRRSWNSARPSLGAVPGDLLLPQPPRGGPPPGCPLPNPRARSSSRDTGYGEVPPRSSAGGLATYGCGIPGRSPHPELYYLRWSEFRTCDDARLRRRPPPTPTGLLLVVNRLHEEVDVVE